MWSLSPAPPRALSLCAPLRYAVKLFWLGAWRKILIDDLMPQSNEGILMYPCSPLDCEMWPILVTKAIVKVLYMYRDETPQVCAVIVCGEGVQ